MDIHEAHRDVETIRAVTAGLSRKRDAVYVALALIYRTGHKWLKGGQAKELRDAIIILEEVKVDPRVKRKLFRFLIEVGWPALETKLRSRYANALRYAWAHHCPIAGLATFIKNKGGIEKCANRYVAQRKSIYSKRTVGDQPTRE